MRPKDFIARGGRWICNDARRGRRIVRAAIRLFRRRGGRIVGLEPIHNMGAFIFRGIIHNRAAATAFTHKEFIENGGVPGRIAKCMEARLQIDG